VLSLSGLSSTSESLSLGFSLNLWISLAPTIPLSVSVEQNREEERRKREEEKKKKERCG